MPAEPQPRADYSRQMLLKEIGAVGQSALSAARVLVIGAGGLGSPVLQYLAGAGVGHLSVVDPDRLEASNVHRQPLYALKDVGAYKADLARSALAAINPEVAVAVHTVRFGAGNARALVADHDVVVDCSDNFRTKFLVNDAAVLEHRPAVFASVYQYEGQLQVYEPDPLHACLRCVWPEASVDGIVGNCAAAGVLGPVPGAFGSLQALLTIKILARIPNRLDGELLLLDFMNFSTAKLKAPRRAGCTAPGCALIRSIAADPDTDLAIQIALPSLAAAAQQNLEVIDIRNADEVAAEPSAARHVAMAQLLADSDQLSAGGRYALLCASGQRSLAAARELRKRGLQVSSIAGGLRSLRP